MGPGMRRTLVALAGLVTLLPFLPGPASAGTLVVPPSCSASNPLGWGSVSASCMLSCAGPGVSGLHAFGGALGARPDVSASGCHGAQCSGQFGCSWPGATAGSLSWSTCSASTQSWPWPAAVNVAVSCWSAGCLSTSCSLNQFAIQTGTQWHIDLPGFDAELVAAGDSVCMPLFLDSSVSDVYECLPIADDSMNLFAGDAAYLPVGIYCEGGDCVPVTW